MDEKETEKLSKISKGLTATSLTSSTAQFAKSTTMKQPIVQNFCLLGLDLNIHESDNDFKNAIANLRQTINNINKFTNVNQCIDLLKQMKDGKVFMIISDTLSKNVIPQVHDVLQLDSIYIFCNKEVHCEQWMNGWPKIKSVSTEITSICESVKQSAQQYAQNSISMSFNPAISGSSNEHLEQIDESFIYMKILKEVLLDRSDFNEQSVDAFASYCRDGNYVQYNIINTFEQEYKDHTSIWWYTKECFLYSMINRSLRNQEVDTIVKMDFFIRALHKQIEQLHKEQSRGRNQAFTTYRGQDMLQADFEQMMETRKGLMSFNNFLLTTKNRTDSLVRAQNALTNPYSVGVLFEMAIDRAISSAPFAYLDNISYNTYSKQEILFSMNTTFHINNIKQIDNNNRLWKVQLTLTADNDQELCALTELMPKQIQESTRWEQLGDWLIKLNENDKAEKVYRMLLDQASDDKNRVAFCQVLGMIKTRQGKYKEAILFYEESLTIEERILPPDHLDLARSYNKIGLIYVNVGDHSKALSFIKKCYEIHRKTLSPNSIELADSYHNIGLVHDRMSDYSTALSSYGQALVIRQSILPPNDSNLIQSYNSVGLMHEKLGNCSKALSAYKQAMKILECMLPPNHRDLATCYVNIGNVHFRMGELSKALFFYEKSLVIDENTLPLNHSDLATSYSHIGLILELKGEYPIACSFYEKALRIRRRILSANHPDLIASYNNIGNVYSKMGQHSKALSFHKQCLQKKRKSLVPSRFDFAQCSDHIDMLHNNSMSDSSKPIPISARSFEILQRSLPPNYPHFRII